MESEFTVTEEAAGVRIDSHLAKMTGMARNQVQNALDRKQVLINGRPAKSSHRLESGDRIEILKEIVDMTVLPPLVPRPDLKLTVIHEDDDILVVEKPPGMLMHPAKADDDFTLINAIVARYPEIATVGESEWRPGIMQRLDKDASGLVAIARNQKAYDHLKKQFQDHTILKEYDALVEGEMSGDRGTVDLPIGRAKGSGRMSAHTQAADADRPAITHYEVIGRPPKATRLTVRTETGRTHQIRVHMRSLGHPIVGDALYGRQNGLPSSRLCLHAKRLGFRHPKDNQWVEFACEPPEWGKVAGKRTGG
ncbi:RluA family pseudouridine synthase [Candidatus Uhrbacteria bacterium]|nr:RluA family pseudouridine synthase [Candidatus Uhrbacteria bacterium]